MSATAGEITTYISNVRYALADYGYVVSNYQKIGSEDIECYKLRFNLLGQYVKLIIDYLSLGALYATDNFFTEAEARDVIQKINSICKTYYMLDL